jgi:hypothetical protein
MTESTKQLSNKEKKLCPRCGKPGSGPYSRWSRTAEASATNRINILLIVRVVGFAGATSAKRNQS